MFGNGTRVQDLTYAGDALRAKVCALETYLLFGLCNFGRVIKTTINELMECTLEISSSVLPIKYEPAGQTFSTNPVADPIAAERGLNFKSSFELKDGLRRLIEWRNFSQGQVDRRIGI